MRGRITSARQVMNKPTRFFMLRSSTRGLSHAIPSRWLSYGPLDFRQAKMRSGT
jgi:hypothetical protein